MPCKSPEARAKEKIRQASWQRADRAKNPQKYRDKCNRCVRALPWWKRRYRNERARMAAFVRASSVCFGDDKALRQALVFESAYAEYEEWFASLDEVDSDS